MPEKAPFKGGLELKFFPSCEFEKLDGISSSEHTPIIVRNALRLLMMGWNDSWEQLFSWSTFKAVFVQRDPKLLKELRLAFQNGFEHLFSQLQGQTLSEEQHEQVQLYLSNCLSLLPYSDPTPYETIKIPQFIEDQWTLVEYHVVPIELTPQAGVKSLFLEDYDRVFAYGLESILNHQAKSHLIFMGTTYPAGQGFFPQVKTDLKGFETVGKSLYRTGRDAIKDWLSKQLNKVEVCGVSLGGSLSLLLAIDQGEKLSRVDALNPAGLHDPRRKSRFDHWDELQSQPKVVIQKQDRDPVSPFGVWKKEWDILGVIPPKEKQGPISFCDHFLNYAGFAETQFNYLNAEEENLQRKARNFWLYSIGRSLIYYPILVPYNYVVRPVVNFIWVNKSYFLVGFVPLIGVTALIAMGFLSGFIVLAAIAACALSLTGLALVHAIKNNPFEEMATSAPISDPPKLHDPKLPRNPAMDIHSLYHEVQVNLTHKELYTYYKVTRCLVKKKEFLPDDEKLTKHVAGINKKELLLAIQDPTHADSLVSIKTTKAKAVHIKHTLTLVNQLGIENEELKSALDKNYRQYNIGKA